MNAETGITALIVACHDNGISLDVVLSDVPEWMLNNRPTRNLQFKNPFGLLGEELNALHAQLWEQGVKVSLTVTRAACDFTKGAMGKLRLKTPDGIIREYCH